MEAPRARQLGGSVALAVLSAVGVAASRRRRAHRCGAAALAPGQQVSPERWELEPQRWIQLALLSLLALISDWVCFSTCAVPAEWMLVEGHESSQLVDIFLFSNVLSCFLFTDITARFGLRRVIIFAGWLMATGCILRSGVPFWDFMGPPEGMGAMGIMPEYIDEVVGTILVGVAQPFFQCSPPLLSATWFGSSERALATATAINFNQVGIATAFIVGGVMATTPSGMHAYFDVVTCTALTVAILTTLFFRDRPSQPPSASAAAARDAQEAAQAQRERDGNALSFSWDYPAKAVALLRSPGFLFPLAAFVASIGCTNIVSTFTALELGRAGFTADADIDLAGAVFQFAIVFGGIVLGSYVDTTKRFKPIILACLFLAVIALLLLGIGEGQLLTFPEPAIFLLLLALGIAAGPVQPIAAELAVEVAYPCDENAVEATQQLAGNLFSALLVPICYDAAKFDFQIGRLADVQGDTLVLLLLVSGTAAYFAQFNSPLRRALLDKQA